MVFRNCVQIRPQLGNHFVYNFWFCAVSCRFGEDIEDSTDVRSWQRFVFQNLLDFGNKKIVQLSVHSAVVDVVHFWEHFEKPYYVRVADSLQLRNHIFNKLA